VAGCLLSKGFHWDVEAPRGGAMLCSSDSVWKVQGQGYVNVYPDGVIRGGKRSARQWSPGQSAQADAEERD
jgi:hypothetical protein